MVCPRGRLGVSALVLTKAGIKKVPDNTFVMYNFKVSRTGN